MRNSHNTTGATPDHAAVAQLRQELSKLENILNSRIHGVAGKASAFPKFTFVVVLGIFVLFIWFMHGQSQKVDSLRSSLRETITNEIGLKHATAMPKEAVNEMINRLQYLELRQDALLDQAKSSMERMYFIFTSVAAFFGLFSIYFGYRQIVVDSRRDESREFHDQEMRNLVKSFQDNITTISSLISTLQEGFEYRKEIDQRLTEIDRRAMLLEASKQKNDATLKNALSTLNRESVEIFDARVDRLALTQQENRQYLSNFSDSMNRAETARDVRPYLNPFCYFLRGLSRSASYEYESAIVDFDVALENGRAHIANPDPKQYAEQHQANIRPNIEAMLVLADHFQGIAHKNLGNYRESRKCFQAAISQDKLHFRSITYLLQVMYFDAEVPFDSVEREYASFSSAFEKLEKADLDARTRDSLKRSFNLLKLNEGNMYVRKAVPIDALAIQFRKESNKPSKALECYWTAYDKHSNDLAAFAVAQAMEGVGASSWRQRDPTDLYREAMASLKRRVAEDPDPLFSVYLYYMLAICAKKLNMKESSEVFLAQARHSLRDVPSHVTVLSPISKIRLFRPKMLQEMEIFEQSTG